MSRLDFLPKMDKASIDNLTHRDEIISGFLYSRSINIIWAKQGTGKTWFNFARSKYLYDMGYEIAYIDTDSPPETIKERGFDKHINGKLHYINAEMFDDSRKQIDETIKSIRENAKDGKYDKCVFILDSLRFFMPNGVYDESAMDKITALAKAVRRAGGTIIILAHSTKKGDDIKVGATLLQAVDEYSELEKVSSMNDVMTFLLKPSKYRMKVSNTAYSVDTRDLSFKTEDVSLVEMNEREKELVETIKKALEGDKLTQNKLLEAIGKDKNDRYVKEILVKHAGRFWGVEHGRNRAKLYTCHHLRHCQHPVTTPDNKGGGGDGKGGES